MSHREQFPLMQSIVRCEKTLARGQRNKIWKIQIHSLFVIINQWVPVVSVSV